MGQQEDAFLNGEANAWYHRNKNKHRDDEILPILKSLQIVPEEVIEFGCGDGWRLSGIKKAFPDATCWGLDPSRDAVYAGGVKHPDINIRNGVASGFWAMNGDLMIFGFCLYVTDPTELFRTAFHSDYALVDGGHLIIHDFDPEYPHKVPYHHAPGLFSYKMDYSKLWLANPAYSLVVKNTFDDGTAVWVLKKDTNAGWPEEARP
jgi:hypothetical protein